MIQDASNSINGIIWLTVNAEGLLSLWDTRDEAEGAASVTSSWVAFPLRLSKQQRGTIGVQIVKAGRKHLEVK